MVWSFGIEGNLKQQILSQRKFSTTEAIVYNTGDIPISECDERWSDWYYLFDQDTPIIWKKKKQSSESGSGQSSHSTTKTEYLIAVDSEDLNPNNNHWHFESVWENWVGGHRTDWRVLSVKKGGVHEITANSIKRAIEKITGGKISSYQL